MNAPQAQADGLRFLDLPVPRPGETVPVAPGIHWLRMPLPISLDHINLWLLDDGDGCVLVDTGMATDATREAWQVLERSHFAHRPLRLIVLTHLHPDHAGLAYWLQERFGVPVWTSRATQEQLQMLQLEPGPEALSSRRAMLARNGLLPEALDELAPFLAFRSYRTAMSGLPQVANLPVDGDETAWDGRSWQWLATGGHAYGHLCLHAAGPAEILIAGDQVLPSISSNVSLNFLGEDPNPLASFLADLARLSLLDRDTLVLPSHGLPFRGLTARALELRRHHDQHLAKLVQACCTPQSATDVLPLLFRRQHRGFQLFLALGEALAHLEYLAIGGRLERLDAGGITRYRARD